MYNKLETRKLGVFALLAALISLSGCATTYIKVEETQNPPPAEPLNAFDEFKLNELTLSDEYAGQDANEKAVAKIQEHLNNLLDPLLENWSKDNGGRTLLIEPEIVQIKFIGGAARFWAGALAGSSAVVMKVKMTDAATGEVIATPEFYQHANAYGGAWSIGGTDNNMLNRIVIIFSEYLNANYKEAVGAPTGKPTK